MPKKKKPRKQTTRQAKKPTARKRRSSSTVLAIDSNHDSQTLGAFHYREQHVYPHLTARGFVVSKCQGPMAKRVHVAPASQHPSVRYITGAGHGSPSSYLGHFLDTVWEVGRYQPEEVAGKIVHFLACESAVVLGRDFVHNGGLAFFGYDDDFVIYLSAPDVYFACDSEIDRAFSDGLTAAEVYDRVQALYQLQIGQLRSQGKVTEAAILEANFDCLRCPSSPAGPNSWGDPKAKLG